MLRSILEKTGLGNGNSLRRFQSCASGNVAMMFGFAFMGVLAASGIAIDFTRQSTATTGLQSVVDSVALSAAKDVDALSESALAAKAQLMFDALTAGGALSGVKIVTTVESSGGAKSLSVRANDGIPATFGVIFGVTRLPVSAASNVPISSKPAEIAMVLDNTGSMSGQNKMTELKKAATNLINTMETASAGGNVDIKVSIVPFGKEVRIGEENLSAGWLNWTEFKGKRNSWSGCVSDRNQPHDTKSSQPTGDPNTWYPAANCGLAKMMPLTDAWSDLRTRIAEMKPSGTTNLTIGLAWGLNMLTHNAPLSNSTSQPEKYNRYMILLTDGMNTQNRWTTYSVDIDARTLEACAQVKAAGIQIFTVRVIDGNEAILQACASRPDMYYSVTDAAALAGVFERISATVRNAFYLAR